MPRSSTAEGGAVPSESAADVGCVAGRESGPPRLIGRDDVVAEVVRSARDCSPPLTVLVGDAGVGRSAVLAEVRAALADGPTRVLALRASAHDQHTRYGALYRLLTDVDGPSAGVGRSARMSVLGLVAKLSAIPDPHDPRATTVQLASAVFSVVRRHAPMVVLIDDAQWLDEGTALLVEPLVRRFVHAGCSIVLTVRSDAMPKPGGSSGGIVDAMRRLSESGLLRLVALRPLTRRQTGAMIADTLRAVPDAQLVHELHAASRGNPSALVSGISCYREVEALRITDRHAYLVPAVDRPVPATCHQLLARVRDSGSLAWPVARAMSVLAPLGPAAPQLVAEWVGSDELAVRDALALLEKRHVLLRRRSADRNGPLGWRFRIPMVRALVESCLGPYERRRLSALAVTAIWNGAARAADPHFLPDRLVDAGKLVDPKRASTELLAHGGAAMFSDGPRAARWLRVAADRSVNPHTRAMALFAHTSTCVVHNRMADSLDSARTLLRNHSTELSADRLQEALNAYLMSLVRCGDYAELTRIAEDDPPPIPGGAAAQIVVKAFALGLLKRWEECWRLLSGTRETWIRANDVTADFGNQLRSGAGVLLGEPGELFRYVAEPERWHTHDQPQHRFEQVRHVMKMLLMLGELDRVQEVMSSYDLVLEQLPDALQFMVRCLRGDWSKAMDVARRAIAAGTHLGCPVEGPMLHLGAARMLIASGWLNRARQMIELGRRYDLEYLFDRAEVAVLSTLGETDDVVGLLRDGLRKAEASGYEVGTEDMWAELAHHEHLAGNHEEASQALDRVRRLAERMGTGRAELCHLVTRAQLLDDQTSAEAAVKLARDRAQPYESALVFTRLAVHGFRTTELLSEAYELYGELDALLLRAQMRQTMRAHNMPVPGRAATTNENERLLAVLVTEGLTNRQLAAVFGTTEKSVEGRLTRMFARIGYRSRVELAAAMLTGEYPG
ncbi:AAA family ATPase [Saccharopolyspora sp. K220]|uniref:AAA family ATPase n=1 Tax=Saccharopolyspora soli TaxID=2926618 RepID=UPI001F59DC89|nr:AAA family ATPase [Saccharopolyspora soli]MCI2417466.1 AAA family ATPase [Saccharopolyspora soli]